MGRPAPWPPSPGLAEGCWAASCREKFGLVRGPFASRVHQPHCGGDTRRGARAGTGSAWPWAGERRGWVSALSWGVPAMSLPHPLLCGTRPGPMPAPRAPRSRIGAAEGLRPWALLRSSAAGARPACGFGARGHRGGISQFCDSHKGQEIVVREVERCSGHLQLAGQGLQTLLAFGVPPRLPGRAAASARAELVLPPALLPEPSPAARTELGLRPLRVPRLSALPEPSTRCRSLLACSESQNHRIPAWWGLAGPSVGHPAQPPCQSRVTQSRLHSTASRRGWNISREGDSTASLGSLGQGYHRTAIRF